MLVPMEGMARKARNETSAGLSHVWARGNNRRAIFVDDVDRRAYLSLLGAVAEEFEWDVVAYCLMTTHAHLQIETREPNLGLGMGKLHSGYARGFNARQKRMNHLFGERFGWKMVESEGHLWELATYLPLNPVEAGICEQPHDWPWSSYAAILHGNQPHWLATARLFELYGGAESYIDWVRATYAARDTIRF